MRRLILLPLAVAACSEAKTDHATLNAIEAEQRREQADDGMIPCAKAGAAKERCTVERSDSPNGLVLTIRHDDGAFRRLLVTKDGRGVVAADGAEPAKVNITGADRIEVSVADERYELPATVKGHGDKQP